MKHEQKKQMAQAKAWFIDLSPPTYLEDKRRLAVDAALASWPYHRDRKKLEMIAALSGAKLHWCLAEQLAGELADSQKMTFVEHCAMLIDKHSGLVAYLFHNRARKEVRLVFGGTTSGDQVGSLMKRKVFNVRISMRQWFANYKNALFGGIPQSYRQAVELTANLQKLMQQDSAYRDYVLTTSGHSKGGGEAAYAALMSHKKDKRLSAICFGSAELGDGLRQAILTHFHYDASQVQCAAKEIRHYIIQGDIIPYVGKCLSGLSLIGCRIVLPRAPGWSLSFIDSHDQFFRHVLNYAKA